MTLNTIRRILFWIVLVSILLVPYSFLAYVCYAGLCGGKPASLIAQKYTDFYGYFFWIYLIVWIFCLIASKVFKKQNLFISTIFLTIPLICLIPFIYVELTAWKIEQSYYREVYAENRAKPTDFSCAPGRFIRVDGNHYYFYDYDLKGKSGSINNYETLQNLTDKLTQLGYQLQQCKNQNNETLENH